MVLESLRGNLGILSEMDKIVFEQKCKNAYGSFKAFSFSYV